MLKAALRTVMTSPKQRAHVDVARILERGLSVFARLWQPRNHFPIEESNLLPTLL